MAEEHQPYDVFQAIADPTRRKLLELLANDEMSISTISKHFPMSRTAVTKHLHVLESAGLVRSQKVGREKLYHLETKPLQKLQSWLEFFGPFWESKLSELKRVVENEQRED
ncbi:metalloregulator ArsR/SmtB family transcription factor [Sporosarcina sp. ACRSM]|uniref:ArsR/SmtB family transcription factor n=1 Tax=Sporosarcina sp. ACRSM TaxID=2918216 RepID=UPI001EF68D3E|nr:metalloregulator ArsR/SmtB family transcription factor [Sporosarcina sp. ACRSM]MCG7335613.1 metalloregulator ArsR/SmtB family transcription factor [Sporosarcina sp. ACRSM]